MNLLVCILIGVVLTIVFMYFAVPFIIWTLTIGLVVGYWQWLALLSVELQIFSWIIVALCISFNIPLIRQILISKALFNLFRKVLPPMSNTEKDAIEAGDVWWDGELFQGSPNWDKLHSVPKPLLSAPEQEFLDNQVNTLCELIDDWQVTHNNLDLSPEVWDYLRAEKFFAMLIPKKYNGLEFSALANSTIVQKIATHSLTAAVTTMVPNSLGPAELLLKYGTEQQKDHYLPRLASGKEIPCFALTAPEAGSDAGAIPDRGVICKGNLNGQEIIGIKLNWNKRYITLAPAASLIGLAFKLFDPDRLLSEEVERGITLCLIPRDTPGIQIGRRHFPLNQAFLNGPIHGKDVFIPLDWLIGGEKMIGRGWIMLVECLAAGRGISLPALSTAAGKLSYLTTGAYASIREQFNTPLAKFEGVTASLAKIAGYTYYLEASRLLTVSGIDLGLSPSVITAIAKYHMTEMARTTVILAMDVHAGKGIMLGPNNYLGRGYQGIPISITVEGANILTRNLIIFGQGAIRCHPFIKEEMLAVINDDLKQGLQQFDKAIFAHIKYTISNFIRLIINSLGGGIFCASPDSDLKYYYRQLGRISLAFSTLDKRLSLIQLR